MGALRVTAGAASSAFPFQGQMTRQQIARDYPDQFVLLISRRGVVHHMQFGRSGVTRPGKMILIHARTPYQLHSETNISSLLINIPGALLRTIVGTPEDYCMIAMDSGHGLNALFCEFLHSIWHKLDELCEDQRTFLAGEFLNFLGAALASVQKLAVGTGPGRSEDQHFERALRFIDDHLSDSSLGVEQIARALRLSHGRLHAIARGKGTSIGQTILDRRLERCRQTLMDERCRHRHITQIAFDWGFKNGTHFSQAFRTKFGVCAREYRKQHLHRTH
jgi:AraC-like DNA-binding protein